MVFIVSNNLHSFANANYSFEVKDKQTNTIHGVDHEYVKGELSLNGRTSNQVYNYVNFNLSQNEDFHMVGVNAYGNFGYGMMGLDQMIYHYELNNPNMEVIAGFNGGFFHINETGESRNTTIDEYQVLQPMTSPNSTILASHTDGSVSFLDVHLDGYEIIVYNSDNEIKYRERIENINRDILSGFKTSIFFDNYDKEIYSWLDPILVKGIDLKSPANRTIMDNDYYRYAKGVVTSGGFINVPDKSFVVVSDAINSMIELGDIIVFQAYIPGFEDVRYGIGTHASYSLVTESQIDVKGSSSNTVIGQHPRTAVGINEAGDPFVVVVDGRNPNNGKDGVDLMELAHIMKGYGAVSAYNFDGGGSSIVMLRNETVRGSVLERFDVLNELSDGNIRAISNGYLLVKGKLPNKPLEIDFPDVRPNIPTLNDIYIDYNHILYFDLSKQYDQYEIVINGISIETNSNIVKLTGLIIGDNYIKVKVKGSKEHKASELTHEYVYRIHDWQMQRMLELLKRTAIGQVGGGI